MADYPSTRGERIEVAIKSTGLSKGAFAAALGLHRQTITRWCASEQIAEEDIERVSELTGKSAPWLRYGLTTAEQASKDRYDEGYSCGQEEALTILAPALEQLMTAIERVKALRPTPEPFLRDSAEE